VSTYPRIIVLLVDDQMVVVEGIRRMLGGDKDIEFHYCNDPKKALDVANEIQPMVILQDEVMPDIDGITLLQLYRTQPKLQNIPVIILSSKASPENISNAFNNGANDYLVKLPDKIELVARIRAHYRTYQALCERG